MSTNMPTYPKNIPSISSDKQTEIEAAVCRKLFAHLRKYPQVQNIELMNLGFFCRNCLAKWYTTAAAEVGVELDYEQSREIVYGMPYAEYQNKHLRPATADQLRDYAQSKTKASE